jgi:hypothetical protein
MGASQSPPRLWNTYWATRPLALREGPDPLKPKRVDLLESPEGVPLSNRGDLAWRHRIGALQARRRGEAIGDLG